MKENRDKQFPRGHRWTEDPGSGWPAHRLSTHTQVASPLWACISLNEMGKNHPLHEATGNQIK